jgi:endonuclease/exonuclease/phosphatase family metal-dependent hydrolase
MYMRFLACLILVLSSHLSQGQSLKVMTYNIRLDTPVDSINQWPKRKQKVFDLIKKYNPDVIGVQEALHHQLMDLVQNLPGYNYIGVGRDDGATKGEYSAILYKKEKLTPDAQKTFWLSETPDVAGSKSWDAAITRVCTFGKFKDQQSGKQYFIFNTHFDHLGKNARANSASLIKEKVSMLSEKLPVIVMGDFNCERNEDPYLVMTAKKGVELFDSKPSVDNNGTFCSFKVNSIACKGIDYIFYSGQWTKENYIAIQDNDGTYYPSDHLPVVAEFKLRK